MRSRVEPVGYGRRFDPTGKKSKLLARLPDGQIVAAQAARTLRGTDLRLIDTGTPDVLCDIDLPVQLLR